MALLEVALVDVAPVLLLLLVVAASAALDDAMSSGLPGYNSGDQDRKWSLFADAVIASGFCVDDDDNDDEEEEADDDDDDVTSSLV